MNVIAIERLGAWVGRTESRSDVVTAWPVAALAATLDRRDSEPKPGDAIPPGWHWLYFLEAKPAADRPPAGPRPTAGAAAGQKTRIPRVAPGIPLRTLYRQRQSERRCLEGGILDGQFRRELCDGRDCLFLNGLCNAESPYIDPGRASGFCKKAFSIRSLRRNICATVAVAGAVIPQGRSIVNAGTSSNKGIG